LGRINGARANDPDNPTRRACDVAVNVRHKLVLRVQFLAEEKVDVSVLLDGKDHVRWKGLRSALGPDPVWKLPKLVGLALGTTQGVVFHSSQLRMLDGTLARLEIRRPESGPSLDPDSEPPPEVVVSSPAKDEKQPVPEGEVVQRSAGVVNDVYKTELQEAKTEQQKSQLANKVLQRADETRNDPAGRYALLRLAYDLAIEAADGNLAVDVVDRMAALYLVKFDLWERKAEVVGTLARQAKRPEDHKAVVQFALTLGAQAQADDTFPVAQQLAKLAVAEAAKARDRGAVEQARAGVKQVEQAVKAFQEVQAALEAIKQKPDDNAAHLTAGRHYCFVKDDWETGLPHLVKSGDAALVQAAGDDLKALADSAGRVPAADGWWDLSEKARGTEQDAMRLRAGFWYKQLLAESGAGLLRARIEKRLEEVARINRASPTGKMKRVVVNVVGMKLALIPAGEFRMGSPDSDTYARPDEKPQHRVRITRPFYLGVYEVTQGEFQRVTGKNLSNRSENRSDVDTSQYPVAVAFQEAVDFCMRLSRSPDEMRAGRAYRLPTEAECEYACRAGTTTIWSFGDNEAQLGEYAWVRQSGVSSNHPVGGKKPNPWGLYDMHGNIGEWCLDCFDSQYYKNSPVADPLAANASAQVRVTRGGAFYSTINMTRSAYRSSRPLHVVISFRVVMIPTR
jgi:formylglycine-generating enzyme required for sulfatase activity